MPPVVAHRLTVRAAAGIRVAAACMARTYNDATLKQHGKYKKEYESENHLRTHGIPPEQKAGVGDTLEP